MSANCVITRDVVVAGGVFAPGQRLWTQSSGSWAWYKYLPFEANETDLDAYAVGHVEGLLDAWMALDSEINGR